MAQPTNKIVTEAELANADYRDRFIEAATSPNDFATGDSSLILATLPYLPAGDSFTDIPLYPVGLAQSFSWNEGLMGQFLPEIGSARKVNTAGTAAGSGVISKILVYGSSLLASLYRPTLFYIAADPNLAHVKNLIFTDDNNQDWIKGFGVRDLDLFDLELDAGIDRVVAAGGMNSVLYKIPFGLIEVKRDAKQRVLAINYLEQCGVRGNQSGLNAGQFQVVDNISFEFERVRPLVIAGIFNLDSNTMDGILSNI